MQLYSCRKYHSCSYTLNHTQIVDNLNMSLLVITPYISTLSLCYLH